MLYIDYVEMVIFITIGWLAARASIAKKYKRIYLKREVELLLVYICFVVIARFTFFPFTKVDGRIQPLILDVSKVYPFRINLEPIVHMNDYVDKRKAVINFWGNVAMFIPIGIVYPSVFKGLNTHVKVIAAGIGLSLAIEIIQLPFYQRVTDIDDLIMNSAGYLIGYGMYLVVKCVRNFIKKSKK